MIIGIGGASRSGKTTLALTKQAEWISKGQTCAVIHQDDYVQPEDQIPKIRDRTDWECPDSMDFEAFKVAILTAAATHQHVIAEGIFVFWHTEVDALFDERIYLQIDREIFMARRREEKRWGEEPEWYLDYVWASHLKYGLAQQDFNTKNMRSTPATATDFDFFYGLYFHPDINPYLLYEPMSEAAFRPIYDDLIRQGILHVFWVAGQPAGMFKLVPFTHRTDHVVYLGGVAMHPSFMGKGHGKALMETAIELARERGYLRIELSTATHNEKAIRLYEQVGFVQEGVLRNYTHLKSEGRYLDEVLMAVLL